MSEQWRARNRFPGDDTRSFGWDILEGGRVIVSGLNARDAEDEVRRNNYVLELEDTVKAQAVRQAELAAEVAQVKAAIVQPWPAGGFACIVCQGWGESRTTLIHKHHCAYCAALDAATAVAPGAEDAGEVERLREALNHVRSSHQPTYNRCCDHIERNVYGYVDAALDLAPAVAPGAEDAGEGE